MFSSRFFSQPKTLSILFFLLALIPRTLALGRFDTVDEAYHWFERAEQFLRFFQRGDYASTNLIGHPGVTTMWLGAAGVLAHKLLASWGGLNLNDHDLHRILLRLPVAFVNSLAPALAYPLLQRIFAKRVAFLAILFWATDPFLIAHGQLLHLDALLTSFLTLSLLTAIIAFGDDLLHWKYLLLSGIAGGLAFLTKSPSIILLPMLGFLALERSRRSASLLQSSFALLTWGGIGAGVWIALWPAAWVNLLGTIQRVFIQVSYDGGSPHGWGNFFLGKAVEDPGPFFYPFAILFRLTPWATFGLMALAFMLLRRVRSFQQRRELKLLLIFAFLFTMMMTFPPKKFDRYILPIFPALNIAAAIGISWLFDHLRQKWHFQITDMLPVSIPTRPLRPFVPSPPASLLPRFSLPLIILLLANVAWYHPYELAYYNPLLGGGKVASKILPIGWGEGLEQAGAYIKAQPNGCERPVAVWFWPMMPPYLCSPAVRMNWALEQGKVDYAILYLDQIQRNDLPEVTNFLQKNFQPVQTVQIQGIDYAFVYSLPQPVAHPLNVVFGEGISLKGYTLDTSKGAEKGVLTLTVQWQVQKHLSEPVSLFVHLLDAKGNLLSQIDTLPGGPRTPSDLWQPQQFITWIHPIPLQKAIASGNYWLALGLYHPKTGERLPLKTLPPPNAPPDGPNSLLLPFTFPSK